MNLPPRTILLGGLLLGTACSDRTPAEPPPPSVPPPTPSLAPTIRLVDLPAADTLARRGIEIGAVVTTHGATNALHRLDMLIDSGTTAERVVTTYDSFTRPAPEFGYALWARNLGNGRHTFVVRATDDSGRVGTTRFTRVFQVPDAAYTVAELLAPDGGDAWALGIGPTGAVVGRTLDARTSTGPQRALRWARPGTAEILPAPDGGSATAIRIDAAGNVLGAVGGCTRIWRADGSVLTPSPAGSGRCYFSADLTETGVALLYSDRGDEVFVDLPSGSITEVPPVRTERTIFTAQALNDRRQTIGVRMVDSYSWPLTSWTNTVAVPDVAYRPCEGCLGHPVRHIALALGNDGVFLAATAEPDLVLQPLAGGRGLRLDSYVGATMYGAMNRSGALVAALDAKDSTLYTFRTRDRAITRVRLADGGWKFDGIGAVNDRGQIAAHAVHVPSGRTRAVLVTPATP